MDEGFPRAEDERATDAESRDQVLARRFQGGWVGAYDEIYKLYSPRVERICRRMLADPDDAAEAAQDSFLRVYQALPRFNGQYQLGAWIARIATNVCLDRLRSRTRKPVDAVPEEVIENCTDPCPGSEQPEEAFIASTESEQVWRTLDGLPPLHKIAIQLRDHEGYTYTEIAEVLEISDSQVKALLHRARKGFRRSWASAGILLPWRLLQKTINKYRAVQSSAEQSIQSAAASTAPSVSGCAAILQQCGQVLGERVASLATAATIGVAAVGAGVAPGTPPVERPALEQSVEDTRRLAVATKPRPDKKTGEAKSQQATETPNDGPAPAPSPTSQQKEESAKPAPAPSTTPTPAPSPTPGSEPKGARESTPPSDPILAFDDGQPLEPVAPTSNEVDIACDSLHMNQRMETVVSDADGDHRALLELNVGASIGLQLTVWKNNFQIRYSGGGTITRDTRSGSEARLTFKGSYGTGNDHAYSAGLPRNGTFLGGVTVDCDALYVVTESIVFSTD